MKTTLASQASLLLVAGLTIAVLLTVGPASSPSTAATPDPCPYPLTEANRPVAPPTAPAERASFTDPTAETQGADFVKVGEQVYVAPFARLEAQSAVDVICIGHAANVQDNTLLKVSGGRMDLGDYSIVAHGAQMVGDGGPVSIAYRDACPLPAPGTPPDVWTTAAERGRQALANALAGAGVTSPDCTKVPAFIGFNALNHSHIEDGALLSVMSRLQPGVVLRAGYTTYPGKSLNSQTEADTAGADFTRFKVRYVTAGDVVFMNAVVHVNECLAKGYTRQYRDTARAVHPFGGPESIHGIGIDPGSYHRCAFNTDSERPTIGYAPDADLTVRDLRLAVSDPNPSKKIRIIGDARLVDIDKIQDHVSIRADEGEPFSFRGGIEWGFANTFHALETEAEDPVRDVRLRANVKLEERVLVHGGGRRLRAGGPDGEPTQIDDNAIIGKEAVVFRSHVSAGTKVGARAVLAGYDNGCDAGGNCTLAEVIPDGCVKFSDTPANTCAYHVEW